MYPVESSLRAGSLWPQYIRNRLTVFQWPMWLRSRCLGAPPPGAKWAVLAEFSGPDVTWIETGTYFGLTTRWLSKRSSQVISLEPDPTLAAFVRRRLRRLENTTVLNESSESGLRPALEAAKDKVCLFLDGHYSGGITYRGNLISPIVSELDTVAEHLPQLLSCRIFVDDFRLFGQNDLDGAYPSPNLLVDFARAYMDGWTVQNGVFVAWMDR